MPGCECYTSAALCPPTTAYTQHVDVRARYATMYLRSFQLLRSTTPRAAHGRGGARVGYLRY